MIVSFPSATAATDLSRASITGWAATSLSVRRQIHSAAFTPCPFSCSPTAPRFYESAKVIGLAGLGRLDPLNASSRGLGDLLASHRSARRIWVGLGGSATVEGGRDWPTLRLPPTTVFCGRIARPTFSMPPHLWSPEGRAPEDIPVLASRLAQLGLPQGPKTGAAGGLGAKLMSLGAELVDGAERILDVLDFDEACRGCEAVITGEGRLDASSLEGKLPIVVARRARAKGLPVIGRFGCKGEGWERALDLFDDVTFES